MFFNRPRAIDYMHRCGVDVLIATSPVTITYFSDYVCWLDPLFKEYMTMLGASSDLFQAYAVFPLAGPTALVVNPLFAVNTVINLEAPVFMPGVGSVHLDQLDGPEFCKAANDAMIVIVQLEDVNAVKNLHDILAVEGRTALSSARMSRPAQWAT